MASCYGSFSLESTQSECWHKHQKGKTGAVEPVTFCVIFPKDRRFLSKFKHNYDESKFKNQWIQRFTGEFRIKLLASSESKVHGSD